MYTENQILLRDQVVPSKINSLLLPTCYILLLFQEFVLIIL